MVTTALKSGIINAQPTSLRFSFLNSASVVLMQLQVFIILGFCCLLYPQVFVAAHWAFHMLSCHTGLSIPVYQCFGFERATFDSASTIIAGAFQFFAATFSMFGDFHVLSLSLVA